MWRRHGRGVEETLTGALAGVEALAAAGAISDPEANAWRDRLRADPEPAEDRPELRAAADRLLTELLGAVSPEDDDLAAISRWEGAVRLLVAAGAADGAAWEARRREHLREPEVEEEWARVAELNAGGTEVELLAAHAGPEERRGGLRVVMALVYADGVALEVDMDETAPRPEWPEWRLRDDVGTAYREHRASGGDAEHHVTFSPAPPPAASWLELSLEGIALRVSR